MKTIKDLERMEAEPASKEWFKKHGMPKAITEHPLKKKMAEKMKKGNEWNIRIGKMKIHVLSDEGFREYKRRKREQAKEQLRGPQDIDWSKQSKSAQRFHEKELKKYGLKK